MPPTYYDVLGVDAGVDQDAIRDAYREKVKEYHPDVSDHPDAEERFKRVKRAEIVLSDPEERATYDRLGHEAYVEGDDPEPNRPSEDEVRWAAAQAAQGNHDAGGGRSAGWRQRERRARRTGRAEWFRDGESPGWTGDGSASGSDDPFAGSAGGRRTGASGATTTPSDAGTTTNSSAQSAGAAADHVANRTAADGWGGSDGSASGHAVHQWGPDDHSVGVSTPGWTQDDAVLLASSLMLYPILLFLTAAPAFPTIARVSLGLCTIALIAFLLPRPAFGLPVFGTWSLLVPAALLGFGISPISAVGIVVLGGVWLPLLYSVAVAMVLR